MKTTPLHGRHVALGARMVEFGGFSMPVQYTGILDEHRTVRSAAGIFDVSHMGEVLFAGPRATEAVSRLFTNAVAKLAEAQGLYTVMCRPSGGIVDDCVVYRDRGTHSGEIEYLVVVNASNIDKDVAWMREVAGAICEIRDRSDDTGLLAVQGPRAVALVQSLAGAPVADLKLFAIARTTVAGVDAVLSRSGYTGEDGFEIFCDAKDVGRLWDALMDAGATHGLKPAGLGARDTLRLEAKLCLYGNDIDDTTTPLEAGLGWVVKLDGPDFVGKDALVKQKAEGVARKLACLEMRERGIARHGMTLHDASGAPIGVVTSGAPSPTLGTNIAMGYVPAALSAPGARVLVDVRGKRLAAEVVKGPFYKRPQ